MRKLKFHWYIKSIALKKIKQLDDAIESFNKAIQIIPDYAEAYNNLGNTLLELGQLDEAKENCKIDWQKSA